MLFHKFSIFGIKILRYRCKPKASLFGDARKNVRFSEMQQFLLGRFGKHFFEELM